jgi:hydroxymethylglutaryl-CoA reductase
MGMNMVSKGVQNVLDFLQSDFPDMDVIGISGKTLTYLYGFFTLHVILKLFFVMAEI